MRKTKIHCDTCGYEKQIPWFGVYGYYKKPCPKCGSLLLRENDIAVWFLITLIMPLNWFAVKICGAKSRNVRLSSNDGGKTYQFTDPKTGKVIKKI